MHNILIILTFHVSAQLEIHFMNVLLSVSFILLIFYSQTSQAWSHATNEEAVTTDVNLDDANAHNQWLKKRFSEQHQQLIPVVAVADMFFICNQTRKFDKVDYKLPFLVNEMDRNTLAEKLSNCLGTDTMQSDVALNFGLFGCFSEQLAHLPKADREQKMMLVKQAVASLSHEERKKSFTQCVTEQSIHYLK